MDARDRENEREKPEYEQINSLKTFDLIYYMCSSYDAVYDWFLGVQMMETYLNLD